MSNVRKITTLLFTCLLAVSLACCVTRRTVKDSSGNTIYSDTMVKKPFQSEKKTMQQAFDKEDELGVY